MSSDQVGDGYFFPTDIALLLTNNSTPSDGQLRETRTILSDCLSSINNLDSEIQRQKAILEDLCAKRTQKQQHVSSCLFVLSPIRNIPSELLAEIFLHVLPRRGKMSFREAPLLLCCVCRSWRDIVMSEPRLWQDLEIKAVSAQGGVIARRGKKYAIAAGEWFRRARSLPLSFHLSLHVARVLSGFTSEDVEDCRPFFQTFVEASEVFLGRVTNLELSGGDFSIITSYLPRGGRKNRYKNLESLVLNFQGYNELIHITNGMEYFHASKELKRLVIGQSYGGWKHTLPEFMFPWSQLTHLYIYNRCMIPWSFMGVLPQCLSLKEVVVHLAEGLPPNGIIFAIPSSEIVTLPYLTHITVQFSDSGNQHILSNVNLPSIESLEISSILKQGMRSIDPSRLQFKAAQWAPFHRHLFPLRRLGFTKSCLVTVPDVLAMLRAAPNVTHLDLTISECSSSGRELIELFKALVAGGNWDGDAMLLPALTEVVIEFRRLGMFDSYDPDVRGGNFLRHLEGVIADVVRSRCPPARESSETEMKPIPSSVEVYGLTRVEIHSQEEEWKPLVQGVLGQLVGCIEVIKQCELKLSAGSYKIGCSPRR